ncbi:MAG: glycerol kinase GlpK [Alphaproteobacteria bacterium]|nr:glycerol kinase GlpK [Alphaproteobacteria bacterium]
MNDQTPLLTIDQGTTSSRAILFAANGDVLQLEQKELQLYYPHKGWVEQDAEDIWHDTLACCKKILDKAKTHPVAIGITNQRETTVVWEKDTGKPLYNAIVWQDRRTKEVCAALKEDGHEEMVAGKTGLLLDPYFSASKIQWILDNVEGAREKADAGELAFGTIDTFLIWRLTKGKVHVTDITNASRTMLYNIVEQDWDDELLALFNVPRSMLPEVKDNVAHFADTDDSVFGHVLPIGGVAGDQQAALIGQGCTKPGMIKATYGTGCFALMHIGDQFKVSENRLLTTLAYRIDGKIEYAVEGSIFVAGAAIQWLRDNMGFFSNAAESESLARSVEDSNEVYFVPAFTGLGAPHWNPDARGMITGLTRETTKAHITRAALEAQAYQTLDLVSAMEGDSGYEVNVVRVDGGLVANRFMCQFLSDMLDCDVQVPKNHECTAWGAAVLAGVYAGVFDSLDNAAEQWVCKDLYTPDMDEDVRHKNRDGWDATIAQYS